MIISKEFGIDRMVVYKRIPFSTILKYQKLLLILNGDKAANREDPTKNLQALAEKADRAQAEWERQNLEEK